MFSGLKNLRSITIGPNVESIGVSAFSGCTNLSSITIPENITSIQTMAFYNCNSLVKVYSKALIPPALQRGAFYISTQFPKYLSVPVGSKAAYQQAEEWRDFSTIEEEVF